MGPAIDAIGPARWRGGSRRSRITSLTDFQRFAVAKGACAKVTKDQQTWRKEFSGGAPAVVAQKAAPVRKQTVTKGPPSKKLLGKKWMVENYSKGDGVVTIEVQSPSLPSTSLVVMKRHS